MRKPRIFIGSTVEAQPSAERLRLQLETFSDPTVWAEVFSRVGEQFLKSIDPRRFDFAVFLLTPEDQVTTRGKTLSAPRDNLVLEIGIFASGIGLERTLIAAPIAGRSRKVQLPSDLDGITVIPIASGRTNPRSRPATITKAALAKITSSIEESVSRLGLRTSSFDKVLDLAVALVQSRQTDLLWDLLDAVVRPNLASASEDLLLLFINTLRCSGKRASKGIRECMTALPKSGWSRSSAAYEFSTLAFASGLRQKTNDIQTIYQSAKHHLTTYHPFRNGWLALLALSHYQNQDAAEARHLSEEITSLNGDEDDSIETYCSLLAAIAHACSGEFDRCFERLGAAKRDHAKPRGFPYTRLTSELDAEFVRALLGMTESAGVTTTLADDDEVQVTPGIARQSKGHAHLILECCSLLLRGNTCERFEKALYSYSKSPTARREDGTLGSWTLPPKRTGLRRRLKNYSKSLSQNAGSLKYPPEHDVVAVHQALGGRPLGSFDGSLNSP
ncbi:MAG: TIR domain-containing protein [Planctomycetota bacterium]